jgi:hypothetical protein
MRRYGWLILWLVGILFPMAWLGRLSGRYQRAFDAVFSPGWMHVLMHLALFAGLVVLLGVTLGGLTVTKETSEVSKTSEVLNAAGFLLVALAVGLLQEGLQLLSGVQIWRWNTLFDLGIDLLGAGLGVGVLALWGKCRQNRD